MPQAVLTARIRQSWWTALLVLATLHSFALGVSAQQPGGVHYFQDTRLPPGAIGQAQLLRGGPLPGYFQPVAVTAPRGAHVAFAADGAFQPGTPSPAVAGLLIGPVYRLKITQIPFQEGLEVYPTIELINRLYPPAGQELRFPIPIEITQQELELALSGRFVTRVIYLEDPETALPRAQDPEHQRYFEVAADQNPLQVADVLGRPVAILRMGSRVPLIDEATGQFSFGMPPLLQFPPAGQPVAPPVEDAFSTAEAPGSASGTDLR